MLHLFLFPFSGWNNILNYIPGRAVPSSEPNAEILPAASWRAHPLYDENAVANDIAIVTLRAPSGKRPVILDLTGAHSNVGRATIALGYGSTLAVASSDSAVSLPNRLYVRCAVLRCTVLCCPPNARCPPPAFLDTTLRLLAPGSQRARLPIVADALCASVWGSSFKPATQLCIGNFSGGVDTCQGDSGGPQLSSLGGYADTWVAGLQVGLTRRAAPASTPTHLLTQPHLIAAAALFDALIPSLLRSYGSGCAQPGALGVYTRISAYASFIAGIVPSVVQSATAGACTHPLAL